MRSSARLCLSLIVVLALGVAPAALQAQDLPLALDVPTPPGVTGYDPAIPTPEEVLGHELGMKHTVPLEVVRYFEAVAAVSDRVVMAEYGRTYEGRPLIYTVVTSPGNHARLETIRQQNLRLSDAPDEVSDADLGAMPVVVFHAFGVHGNEPSTTDSALLYLYHLAAGQGPGVEDALEDAVLIIDPMLNPDGRDRFADWVNRHNGPVVNPDPQHTEHSEPWPGGRTNHYWFDLNRDWLPLAHPESRGRVELYHAWRPQVLTDHHEMGSNATYFFMPGIPSRVNPNTPTINQELTAQIGAFHAQYLDEIGALYYSKESFDDFYYGKGSSFPDAQGTVGILFEQASSRAHLRETVNGLLSYAFTIRNQFTTSISTLQASTDLRDDLLRYQRDFYAGASAYAQDNPVKGYVLDLTTGRSRAQHLARLLQDHRIRVHDLAAPVTIEGTTYEPGSAYLVPTNQPQARFLNGIMETMTTFEDSLFYDVSSWTLPLTYGLTYGRMQQSIDRVAGEMLPPIELDGGALVGGQARYAYIMPWGRYYAPRALYRLQAAGLQVRLMRGPLTASVDGEPQAFEAGSIVIPVVQPEVSSETVHELVASIPAMDHVMMYAIDTGLSLQGIDLGSPQGDVLELPSVGLVVGAGTNSNSAGEAWHLFNERMAMPVTLLDTRNLGRADLSRYNTLIMTGGSYGSVPAEAVRDWVRSGGRLIATTSAADWAIRNDMVDLTVKDADLDSLFEDLPYDQLDEAYGAQRIGGSIFEATLDVTHPLAYGYDDTLPVFRRGTTFYEPSDRPGTNVATYAADPLLSGYISEEMLEMAGGSASVVAQRVGRGAVILMMDNPNFRAFWYGTNGLFLNAVFFGGSF